MNYGYEFYFKDGAELLTLPITPEELSIKVDSNNKVVTLINEGDINILKSPSLIEIEFTARFPMRQYPYARKFVPFKTFHDLFESLKEQKKSFRFIVARTTLTGLGTWDTNLLVTLESYKINESADEGDDVLVDFKLKQYKEYGVKKVKVQNTSTAPTTSTSTQNRSNDNKTSTAQTYTVKYGDCLWNIAKKYYGSGSKYTVIYDANKTVIEDTAKKNGKQSSRDGWLIWPGTVLTIPAL